MNIYLKANNGNAGGVPSSPARLSYGDGTPIVFTLLDAPSPPEESGGYGDGTPPAFPCARRRRTAVRLYSYDFCKQNT
jgi:hypothetical protein